MNHRKYPCSECDRFYDNIIDFADHKLNFHRTTMIKFGDKWRKCKDFLD